MPSFRKAGVISIWLMQEIREGQDDFLKIEFGIDYYDLDCLEVVGDPEWESDSVENVIEQLSYSESFLAKATKAANKAGIVKTRRAIAIYDFAYDPKRVKLSLPSDPVFIGYFSWSDEPP